VFPLSIKADLIKLILALKRKVDTLDPPGATAIPSPEPPEPEPTRKTKPVLGTQEWYRQLPPPTNNQGVSMNDLARTIPKRRPPRRPSWER
jgi:hypothetical protein